MGRLYNKIMPIETIHEAYGITIKGEIDGYSSFLSPDIKRTVVRLWINDTEIDLGANDIFRDKNQNSLINIEDDKEILCYWLSLHPMDQWQLDQFFIKEYKSTLWRYKARIKLMRNEK